MLFYTITINLLIYLCSCSINLPECADDQQYVTVQNCSLGYRLMEFHALKEGTCEPKEASRIDCCLNYLYLKYFIFSRLFCFFYYNKACTEYDFKKQISPCIAKRRTVSFVKTSDCVGSELSNYTESCEESHGTEEDSTDNKSCKSYQEIKVFGKCSGGKRTVEYRPKPQYSCIPHKTENISCRLNLKLFCFSF